MKKALKFTLPLLPVALVAGYFVTGYQLETLDPTMLEEALAQIGGTGVLTLVSMLQTLGYTLLCGVLGHILAQKVGLVKTVRFEKKPLLLTLCLSLVFGVIFSLDYWTFGAVMPELRAGLDQITVNNWVASILYGGIVEELMLRLFFMSLIAWILQKLLRKQTTGILIAANVIAAILFAAGHLPAIWMAFGELTPMLLFRCFLLNGGFGLFFGWAYRKYGIQYAMIAHASLHIVSKLIWTIFI